MTQSNPTLDPNPLAGGGDPRLAEFFHGRAFDVFRSAGAWMTEKAGLGLGAAMAGLTRATGMDQPELKEVQVRSALWPDELSPIKVAFLADPHVGSRFMQLEDLGRVVDQTNALAPDLVILGGDYMNQEKGERAGFHRAMNGGQVEPEMIAGELGRLKAPGGVFAVLGNHDWDYDGQRVRHALEGVGIQVLENHVAEAKIGNHQVVVAGLADEWESKPDVARVKEDLAGRPHVLVAHNPTTLQGVDTGAAVMLAGHTHGNQAGGNLDVIARQPLVANLLQKDSVREALPRLMLEWLETPPGRPHTDALGQVTYVSSGLGTSSVPLRMGEGAKPEITLIELVAAAQGEATQTQVTVSPLPSLNTPSSTPRPRRR